MELLLEKSSFELKKINIGKLYFSKEGMQKFFTFLLNLKMMENMAMGNVRLGHKLGGLSRHFLQHYPLSWPLSKSVFVFVFLHRPGFSKLNQSISGSTGSWSPTTDATFPHFILNCLMSE